jgi:hypothetical protein
MWPEAAEGSRLAAAMKAPPVAIIEYEIKDYPIIEYPVIEWFL